jgi:thioredoxin reductase (NADPH)
MATTRIRAERFPDLADEVLYLRVPAHKMAWLAEKGERRAFAPGEVLYEQGLRDAPFFIVESGRVDLIDRRPGKEIWIAEADAGTFIGDIATFTGEPAMAECVAAEPTETIAFDRPGLRALLAASPEMGELVLGCLLARRAWHEGAGHGVLRLIAERGSRRAFEVRDLLERNLVPLRFHDVDLDPYADKILDWLGVTRDETPVLVRNDRVLRNPSAAQLARELGLRAEVDAERFDLAVLGGGPAGLAAAVSASSEGLRTVVLEAWGPGGQAGASSRIENYLGFPAGISGVELTRAATVQARRFDAVLSSFHRAVEVTDGPEGLTRVDLDDGQHVVAPRSSWPPGSAGASWRSPASSAIAGRASTTRRCRPTPISTATRTCWWSAAATRPGRRRRTSRATRGACAWPCAAGASRARCRATWSTASSARPASRSSPARRWSGSTAAARSTPSASAPATTSGGCRSGRSS